MFRKLIMILIIITHSRMYIYGETKYSEFNEFSKWQEEEIIESDLIDVDVQKRYKWYKIDQVDGTYSIENYNDPMFPYVDKNDFIIKDFTNYSIEKPNILPNRTIEEKMFHRYRTIHPIKYIHLMNVHSDLGKFNISELNVFIDGVKVDYDFYCGKCSENFGEYINDHSIYQDNVYIGLDKTLTIDLKGYYDASRIKVDMYLHDSLFALKQYEIIFSPYPIVTKPQYFYKKVISYFFTNNIYEVKLFSYRVDNSWLKEPEWYDWNYSEHYIESSFMCEVNPKLLYRYKDILYKYYKINKIYYDDKFYETSPHGDYKYNDQEYKYYYRYRTRTVLKKELSNNEQISSVLTNNTGEIITPINNDLDSDIKLELNNNTNINIDNEDNNINFNDKSSNVINNTVKNIGSNNINNNKDSKDSIEICDNNNTNELIINDKEVTPVDGKINKKEENKEYKSNGTEFNNLNSNNKNNINIIASVIFSVSFLGVVTTRYYNRHKM